MRFVTFRRAGSHPEAGVVRGDEVISLSGAGFPDTLSVIRGGAEALTKIEALCARPPAGSGSVICVSGRNGALASPPSDPR